MEAPPRFTRQVLIREADATRPGITERLVTKWVEIGLLDRPYKPGRGRRVGGSHPGTWSYEQLHLFLALWRQYPIRTIADLCNVPVFMWMYWGDDYVPLKQVRKAMNTWLARIKHVPRRAADDSAEKMLTTIEGKRPGRAKRELLAEALRSQPPDLEQARSVLVTKERAPYGTIAAASGRTVDVDPELVMGLLGGRVAAEEQLTKLPNYLFEWARLFNLYASGLYLQDQPSLAADSRHGRLFPERKVEDMIWHACADLLTNVGASLKVKISPTYKETFLHPDEWKSGRVRGVIRNTEMREAGLAVDFEIIAG